MDRGSDEDKRAGEDWWLGSAVTIVLAGVSSFIFLLFVVTLLLHFLPRLQKWLLPLLTKIVTTKRSCSSSASPAAPHLNVHPNQQRSPSAYPSYQHPALHVQPFQHHQRFNDYLNVISD